MALSHITEHRKGEALEPWLFRYALFGCCLHKVSATTLLLPEEY
jgi:hypothetical protein